MQVTRAHAAWSLQMSVGVSGASLAVDTEGRLYTVFISPRTVYLPFWYVPLQNRLPFLGELQQRSCSHCLLDTGAGPGQLCHPNSLVFLQSTSDCSSTFLLRTILPLVNQKSSPESCVDITNSSRRVA